MGSEAGPSFDCCQIKSKLPQFSNELLNSTSWTQLGKVIEYGPSNVLTSLYTAVNGLELGMVRVESPHECPILTLNEVSTWGTEEYQLLAIETLIVTISVVTVATGVLVQRSNELVPAFRLLRVVDDPIYWRVYPPQEQTPAALTVSETPIVMAVAAYPIIMS